jgi:hypothetical protein
MSFMRWAVIASLLSAASRGSAPLAQEESERTEGEFRDEWTIRPEGLGRLDLRRPMSVAQARAFYPEAKVEIRRGRFNSREAAGYWFVFLDGERELFGTPCPCTPGEDGKPRFEVKEWDGEEHVPLNVFTSDPRFRTERGVGVGSTVAELRKAYPDYPKLVYHQIASADGKGPPSMEYVCLLAEDANLERWGRLGTVEKIRFYVRHPDPKKAAGRPRWAKKGQWVDPAAVIVTVEPRIECNPDPH